jgi:hypothetical protein
MIKFLGLIFLLLIQCTSLDAHELYLLGGALGDTASRSRSYTWSLEYMHGINEQSAFSVSWLNEGHLPNNHRDGIAAQLWGRTKRLDNRFVFATGIGPYYYYDTEFAGRGRRFSDSHGLGGVFSLAGLWYTESPWVIQLRANIVKTNNIDTFSAMIGVGYQLDSSSAPRPPGESTPQSENNPKNEITAFVGQTIANSFDSRNSTAGSVEYRRGVAPHLDWTVAWLYEGDDHHSRRHGIMSQIWAVQSFNQEHLTLGIGIGPYVLVDRYSGSSRNESADPLAGMITLSASYRLGTHWLSRISWNRMTTNDNHDSDVILAGAGYRF